MRGGCALRCWGTDEDPSTFRPVVAEGKLPGISLGLPVFGLPRISFVFPAGCVVFLLLVQAQPGECLAAGVVC